MPGLDAVSPTLSPEALAARNAESNLPFILGITIASHSLAIIAVLLRCYVRAFIVKVVGWDDFTIILALAGAIGGMVAIGIEAPLGLGRHQDTISKDDLKKFKHANFVYTLMSAIMALNLIKISVSFLLMRFVQHRYYKRFLRGMIVFMIVYGFVAWGTVIFLCLPVAAFWDSDLRILPTTKCYPITAFTKIGLMNTGINIASDVILATLPIPIIWKLQINKRQKIALIGVLSMGYLAVAIGIVKSFYQVTLPTTPDQTFQQGIQTWGFVQTNVGIVAACMPALRPLFSFLADSISSRGRSRAPSHGNRAGHSGYYRQNDSSGAAGSGLRSIGRDGNSIPLKDYPGASGLEAGNKTKITIRENKNWGDSGSEEGILPYQGTGIVRTTEFIVK